MRFILKLSIWLGCLTFLTGSLLAFLTQAHRKIEVEFEPTSIILSNGRILKEYIATGEGKLFIPYELVESLLDEQMLWDPDTHTLNIGNIPTASVMSDKLKVYHYDYDDIHSFLYCPEAKTNKSMTMANHPYTSGYYFTNIFSASFNLDGHYKEVTGYLGCEDFKSSNGQIDFYLDDVLIYSCAIHADDLPTELSLNVAGGKQLKLTFTGFKPDTQIDFADVYIY